MREWERRQYLNDDGLRARIETHDQYSERTDTWRDWLAGLVPAAPPGPLLDAGCGNGAVFAHVAPRIARGPFVACDLSLGMLDAARLHARALGLSEVHLVNSDVQLLPFADASFAVAMANHMLYHVPDIPRAIAELHRVLQPGGVLLASTGSRRGFPELAALHMRGVQALALPFDPGPDDSVMARFNIDDHALLFVPPFAEVQVCTREDALVFPAVAPFMRYYLSGPIYVGAEGPGDLRVTPEQWDALAAWVAAEVQATLGREGVFRVRKPAGAFLARKGWR